MFKEGLPTGEVGKYIEHVASCPFLSEGFPTAEKASIDEAFIDFTLPVRDEILKRHPYLAEVPPDAPLGKDTPLPPPPPISWDGLGTVIPVNPPRRVDKPPESSADEEEGAQAAEANASIEEEEGVDEDDAATTWHDVALSIAAELMGKIRHDIYTKLGYSTSAVSVYLLTVASRLFILPAGYCSKQVPGQGWTSKHLGHFETHRLLLQLTASYKKPNSQVSQTT